MIENIDSFCFDDPARRALVRDALRRTYFARYSDELMATPEWAVDIDDHTFGRYNRTLLHYIPWIDDAHPLAGVDVIEIGCGTGSSTAAFARFAKSVDSYEIEAPCVAAARSRMELMGLHNVRINEHRPEDSINAVCERHRGGAQCIALFAVLEHMTIDERLESLSRLWSLLQPGGILIVAETPNRLTYANVHTSRLPFFHLLPTRLRVQYFEHSPRSNFRDSIRASRAESVEHGEMGLVRWGDGASYHEFEIAFGTPLDDLIIADGRSPHVRAMYPSTREEILLRIYFEFAEIRKPLGFVTQFLNIIFRKPAPAR